jgi:hypothetical protein
MYNDSYSLAEPTEGKAQSCPIGNLGGDWEIYYFRPALNS